MEYEQGLEDEVAQIEKEIKKGGEDLDYYRRILVDYRGTGNAFDARGSDGRRRIMRNSEDQTSLMYMPHLELPPGVEYPSDRSFPNISQTPIPIKNLRLCPSSEAGYPIDKHCWQWAWTSRAAV